MLTNRPFRVLVSMLVVLGFHVCCCQSSLFGWAHGHGGDEANRCSDGGCSCDDDGQSGVPPEAPEAPPTAPHECCGVHAIPLTTEAAPRLELPQLCLAAILPVAFMDRLMAPSCGSAVRSQDRPPLPESSLLRRHCALIV